MRSTIRAAFVVVAAYSSPSLLADARAQSDNPACALLTLAEIRAATGIDYEDGSEGDALGEGAGGGASCQWGGATFNPGKPDHPQLSLVLIPLNGKASYAEGQVNVKPRTGCTREKLPGIGDVAFWESCERYPGPETHVKAGKYDLIVQMNVEPPATPASVRPAIVAVAKAAAAKARTKS